MITVSKDHHQELLSKTYPFNLICSQCKLDLSLVSPNYDVRYVSQHFLASMCSEFDLSVLEGKLTWSTLDSNPITFLVSLIRLIQEEYSEIQDEMCPILNASFNTPTIDFSSVSLSTLDCIYRGLRDDQLLNINTLIPVLCVNRDLYESDDASDNVTPESRKVRVVGNRDCLYDDVYCALTTFGSSKSVNKTIRRYMRKEKKEWFDLDTRETTQKKKKSYYSSDDLHITSDTVRRLNFCDDHIKRIIYIESEDDKKPKRPPIKASVKKELYNKYYSDPGYTCSCGKSVTYFTAKYVEKKSASSGVPRAKKDTLKIVCAGCYKSRTNGERKQPPKAVRDSVWSKITGQEDINCFCCMKEIVFGSWHASHIKSHKDNGSDTVDNLRICCSACNQSMGSTNMLVYIKAYHRDNKKSIKELSAK